MNSPPTKNMMPDVQIIAIKPRLVGGAWATGHVEGHHFTALIFPKHATTPGYELGDSRISKMTVKRIRNGTTVFEWERGLSVPVTDWEAAGVVSALTTVLADLVFGPISE